MFELDMSQAQEGGPHSLRGWGSQFYAAFSAGNDGEECIMMVLWGLHGGLWWFYYGFMIVFMTVYGNYLDFMVKNGDELDYPSLIIGINGQKNNGEKMVLWELMGIK